MTDVGESEPGKWLPSISCNIKVTCFRSIDGDSEWRQDASPARHIPHQYLYERRPPPSWAMANLQDATIYISESEDDANPTKRKREAVGLVYDKVQLTDESDGPVKKPKKRRAKRKSSAKSKNTLNTDQKSSNEDELPDIPEYLRIRRRAFQDEQEKYHENALMIPPDYSGIQVLNQHPLLNLEVRPHFEKNSGIKPSRPYKDIHMPQSAGVIPAPIARYLRDYQVDGVKFMHEKFVYQEGCILGDDMGLGKTVQVAAFLSAAFGKTGDERDAKRMREVRFYSDRWYPRILIVCPGSLIMNWKNEMTRWGWWNIDIFHGAKKEDILATARAGLNEIMITTYDTYKNCRSAINLVQWDAVIADECHRLKDGAGQTTKAMQEVNALCRIGLTGTAIQNKYDELWTLLDWANPGHFGSLWEWQDQITKPLTVGQSHDATASQLALARQVAQKLVQNLLPRYFLRRMKTLIADQLPKKTDRVAFCPLTSLQLEAYKSFLSSQDIMTVRNATNICSHGNAQGWCCRKTVSHNKHWKAIVFPGIVTLQKIANHLTLLTPKTSDLEEKHVAELTRLKTCLPDTWKELYEHRDQIKYLVHPEYCGKWKVLKRLLQHWERSGDKVLVFSHSVRLLRILQHLFATTHYTHSYLDGSVSYEQRQQTVDTFNSDPSQFVFLISTKAGGVGLNITAANKVVIMDPHWNPSYDLQAQDRAYRIGQTRNVEVFRLISTGTIEEIVYARQIYKQQQANIGYSATSERRYFKGVQEDASRKGEIFGLSNIFTHHSESGLLRDIVNKTNIAEAKAGVKLVEVDMEAAATEASLSGIKDEVKDEEDGAVGMSQLASLLTSDQTGKDGQDDPASEKSSGDVIQAILNAAGVDYTHDNAQVVGSSKVEEQLSRKAALLSTSANETEGHSMLFAASDEEDDDGLEYNPPEAVQLRQFCEMAKHFGFSSPIEFALVVEGWSQEQRSNCLERFYKKQAARFHDSKKPCDAEDDMSQHADDGPSAVKNEGGHRSSIKDKPSKEEAKSNVKVEAQCSNVEPDYGKLEVGEFEEKKLLAMTELRTWPKQEHDEKPLRGGFKAGANKRESIFLSDDDDEL